MPVKRNISEQLKLEKCKASLGHVVKQIECTNKSNKLEGAADNTQQCQADNTQAACCP
jgi:hypothetical protein